MKQFGKKENGRTMVEMIGVISVVCLLTVVTVQTWGYLSSLFASQRVNDIVLKSILAVNSGAVVEANDLKRFYNKYLPEYNISSVARTCRNQKRKNDCTYTVEFLGVNPKIVARMVHDADRQIYTAEKVDKGEGVFSLQLTLTTDNKKRHFDLQETE